MRVGWIGVVLFVASFSGCAPYALVESKQTVVRDTYIVEPKIKWNSKPDGAWDVWTQDGPKLDSLTFFAKVADGKPLAEQSKRLQDDSKKLPVFKKSMSEIEVGELIETTLSMMLAVPIASRGLAPAQFAGGNGFRLSFDYVGKDEVEREGIAVGALKNDALYLVIFQGTKLYHFAKYRTEAERLIESLRLK